MFVRRSLIALAVAFTFVACEDTTGPVNDRAVPGPDQMHPTLRLFDASEPRKESGTLLVPQPRGFCAGVVRAIDVVRIALEKPVVLIKAEGTGPLFDIDNMMRVFEYSPNLWQTTIDKNLPDLRPRALRVRARGGAAARGGPRAGGGPTRGSRARS